MPIEFVNRKGDRYYLLQGKTKTGKPKYFASRKCTGDAVEVMPEGYEMFEQPEQGIVSVRKIRPTSILPAEREKLTALTRALGGTEYFIVDVQGDSLVVYTPGDDPAKSASVFDKFMSIMPSRKGEMIDLFAKNAVYMAMFRFTLVDEERRLFELDRWCFRGGIDGWFSLAAEATLEKQAKKFLPHLTKESFYELM